MMRTHESRREALEIELNKSPDHGRVISSKAISYLASTVSYSRAVMSVDHGEIPSCEGRMVA